MSIYHIEIDDRKTEGRKDGSYLWAIKAIRERVNSGWLDASQVVYENGEIVGDVFDSHRSHFSVDENKEVFRGFSLDQNFQLLRKMCSLGDPETEHVTSLITSFSLTDEYGKMHEVEVGEGKYKSALFLYWISEGRDEFRMDDQKRQLVWDYFGHDICGEAIEKPNTTHTTVRYLLNQIGSRVRINPTSTTTNQEGEGTDESYKPTIDEEATRI